MTHYTMLVATEGSEIDAQIQKAMAPYDENMDVEPYDKPCDCGSTKANRAGYDAAEERAPKKIDEYRTEYNRLSGERPD